MSLDLNELRISEIHSVDFDMLYLPFRNVVTFRLQSAPLTEEQQAAIVSLSHAVAERPFPANLVSVEVIYFGLWLLECYSVLVFFGFRCMRMFIDLRMAYLSR